MVITGLNMGMEGIEFNENNPFIYWHECHASIECYVRYLYDAWVYTMNGVAGIDITQALAVISCYTDDKQAQLQMLGDVKAFASGVKQYYDDQKTNNS